jgi:hypothetical protein
MSAPTKVEAVRIQQVFLIRIQPQSPESLSGSEEILLAAERLADLSN